MSIFLILASIGVLVDPFPIILAQTIKVQPESTRLGCCHPLWTINIHRNLILPVLQVHKSSARIGITIKIIVTLLTEMRLIVFMLEHLPLHRQPTVRISNKSIFILDRSYYLKVQIRKMVCF